MFKLPIVNHIASLPNKYIC